MQLPHATIGLQNLFTGKWKRHDEGESRILNVKQIRTINEFFSAYMYMLKRRFYGGVSVISLSCHKHVIFLKCYDGIRQGDILGPFMYICRILHVVTQNKLDYVWMLVQRRASQLLGRPRRCVINHTVSSLHHTGYGEKGVWCDCEMFTHISCISRMCILPSMYPIISGKVTKHKCAIYQCLEEK